MVDSPYQLVQDFFHQQYVSWQSLETFFADCSGNLPVEKTSMVPEWKKLNSPEFLQHVATSFFLIQTLEKNNKKHENKSEMQGNNWGPPRRFKSYLTTKTFLQHQMNARRRTTKKEHSLFTRCWEDNWIKTSRYSTNSFTAWQFIHLLLFRK